MPKEVSEFISERIREEREAGYPQNVAIAMAYNFARKRYPDYKSLLEKK